MTKREFWKRLPYVDCPEADCEYQTKVRSSLIAHLVRVHGFEFMYAKDKADGTGIYCPMTYRRFGSSEEKKR